MSKKIAKALIGGNWKCNGTIAQVKSMIETLNKAGPFSPNSEVVIAAPSIHLGTLLANFRLDIATSAEVLNSLYFHHEKCISARYNRMSVSKQVTVLTLVRSVLTCSLTLESSGLSPGILKDALDSASQVNQMKLSQSKRKMLLIKVYQ
jgi:hypothetical protein